MRTLNQSALIFLLGFFFSCNNNKPVKTTTVIISDTQTEDAHDEEPPPSLMPPNTNDVNVAAYLIYEDNTTSSFDVLNDHSKALWNTIIGAGDAEKPSKSTKIVLMGKLAGVHITVYNGKNKAINEDMLADSKRHDIVIDNTGCAEVKVSVTKLGKEVYKGTIPFHCGE